MSMEKSAMVDDNGIFHDIFSLKCIYLVLSTFTNVNPSTVQWLTAACAFHYALQKPDTGNQNVNSAETGRNLRFSFENLLHSLIRHTIALQKPRSCIKNRGLKVFFPERLIVSRSSECLKLEHDRIFCSTFFEKSPFFKVN